MTQRSSWFRESFRRIRWIGLVLASTAVAHADTVQNFNTPAGGTAYAQTDARNAAPPELPDFGGCNAIGVERVAEDGRSFLRLAHDSAPPDCSAVTFNCVEAATTGNVAIDFDFRVSNPDHGDAADGFSVTLLDVGPDLAPGVPPIDVDEFAGPEPQEAPALHRSLGFGFRVYRFSGDGPQVESVKAFWDGAVVQRADLPADQSMVDIGWIHAAIRVDFAAQQASVLLTRGDGSQLLRMPAFAIPGLQPYAARVHLAARTGGANANFDFDDVNVAFPPRDPAVVGSWSPALSLASVPIHAALLPGGKVLYWDRHDYPTDARPQIWDGVASTASHNMPTRPDGEHYDMFCAGHAFAADGSLFVAGGHIADNYGEPWASRFDPAEQHWTALAPMQAGRWYPTVAILPDGDLVVASGAINPFATNDVPEIYDVRANHWRPLTGARRPLPFYPFLFTTPRGLFAAGSMIDTGFLDPAAPGRWIPVDQTLAGRDPASAIGRDYGTAVLTDAEHGRILVIGGTTHPASGDRTQRTTEWIDLSDAAPRWRAGPTMTFARRMHVGTLLPDGSVLVTGGTAGDAFSRADGAILNPELLTNLEDAWRPMACASEARVYHSVAVLLPDARVLVAGGGHPGEIDHPTGEIFSPPYLHRGGTQLAAPVIAVGPGVVIGADGVARVRYGATIEFTTPDPSRVAAVHWLRPAAVTHAFNQDQRIVRLAAGDGGIGSRAVAPSDPAIAPPGPYMMFLIDSNGVPSHAAWLRTNLPPEAADDVIEIVEGQSIPNILDRIVANDVDVEHDPITATLVDPPHAGTIVGGTYVPNPGFSGDDSFTYTLSDGLDTSRIAVATIRIADIDRLGCAVGPGRSSPWLALAVAALVLRRHRNRRAA